MIFNSFSDSCFYPSNKYISSTYCVLSTLILNFLALRTMRMGTTDITFSGRILVSELVLGLHVETLHWACTLRKTFLLCKAIFASE